MVLYCIYNATQNSQCGPWEPMWSDTHLTYATPYTYHHPLIRSLGSSHPGLLPASQIHQTLCVLWVFTLFAAVAVVVVVGSAPMWLVLKKNRGLWVASRLSWAAHMLVHFAVRLRGALCVCLVGRCGGRHRKSVPGFFQTQPNPSVPLLVMLVK